jgi:predicted peptidase
VFEEADHDQGWRLAYTTTELFDWLLQQSRSAGGAMESRKNE